MAKHGIGREILNTYSNNLENLAKNADLQFTNNLCQ
jgi:hypothetical protein